MLLVLHILLFIGERKEEKPHEMKMEIKEAPHPPPQGHIPPNPGDYFFIYLLFITLSLLSMQTI